MPNYRTHLQDHHNIEQQTLNNSPLLAKLQQAGKFNIHAPENRLFLPTDPQFANALGVTPHSGGPLHAYQDGMLDRLGYLQRTRDGQAVLDGDPSAMDRIAKRVEQLRDTVKVGLINGDLNTNTPFGQTPTLTNQKIRYFFDNIPAYYQTHVQQIEALKGFTGIDHGWGAIAHSESRIVTTLSQIHFDSRPITRGGNIELQRSGLSLAIANAHHDGRVVLSEPGIRRVELVLGEESAYRIRVPPSQQGFASLQLLLGDASASTLVRSGGLLASGADAVMTTHRAAALLEQGNATAAQSEVNHALARNAGGWLGGTATAYLVGTSSFAPAALVAADALLMSKAFDKGADLLDNRKIYQQVDTAGVEWQFSGRNWERQAAMDRTPDGVDNPARSAVGASYEKARELGAKASVVAVEQALGKAPAPQDPFNLPARASDQHALDNPNWQRNPQTEQWQRQVKTRLTGVNDRGVYATELATPERSRELNQEALARIEANIAQGQEAIAGSYLESYATLRWQDYVPEVPSAVEMARAKPDFVRGSDNQLYHRDEGGQWSHAGRLAQGNLALELELTRQIRQPSLERAEQALAEIQARPAPTIGQSEQNELLHRYRTVGTGLNPEWQDAIALATSRTRQAHGITGATLQELQPGETGQLGADSPIVHYQTGSDGIAHPIATTSTDELRQAWMDVRAQRHPSAPIPDSPELRIEALSPQRREAYQQALHEANRQGGAASQVQQVAAFTAREVQGEQTTEPDAPQAVIDARRNDDMARPPAAPEQAAPSPTLTATPLPQVHPKQSQAPVQKEAARSEAEGTRAARVDDDARVRQVARADTSPGTATPRADQHETLAPDTKSQSTQLPETTAGGSHSATSADPAEQQQVLADQTVAVVQPAAASNAPDPQHQVAEFPLPISEDNEAPPKLLERQSVQTAGHEIAQRGRAPDVSVEPAEPVSPSAPTPARAETMAPTPPEHPDHAVHRQVLEDVSESLAKPDPTQPGHPDHGLYLQVRQGVAALDAKHGRSFDAVSERMTASLLVLAKDNDLERVDHVLVSNATTDKPAGHTLFVVQGEPSNPAHQRASMPTEQAAQTSVEESMQQFDVVSQEAHQRALANQLEQQLEDQRVQHDIQIRAASMG